MWNTVPQPCSLAAQVMDAKQNRPVADVTAGNGVDLGVAEGQPGGGDFGLDGDSMACAMSSAKKGASREAGTQGFVVDHPGDKCNEETGLRSGTCRHAAGCRL